MARPKKRRRGRGARRKLVPQHKPAASVAVDLSAHEEMLADLAARLLTDETPDAETLDAGLTELRELGDPITTAALARLAQEGGAQALPVLEAALSDDALALGAARALARVADPEAARLLDGIVREHPDRAVTKAARKSIFELRRAGIAWEAPVDETPREEWPLYKAIASHIDGEGTRSVWIARRGAFGGLRVANFILNEVLGIKDCYGADDFGLVDFDRIINEGAESDPPIIYAEIDLPYARRLIEEARALNKESGFQLPLEFYAWRNMLGEPQPDEEEQPRPVELSPDVVREHPEWLDKGEELLELPTCRYWILDAEDVEPYLGHYARSKLRELEGEAEGITDLGAKQDEGIIVRRAVREIFDEKRSPRMQRRLDETAMLLWLTDQQEEARWAAAAALTLAEETPDEVPFLYELVHISLDLLMASMLDELGPEGFAHEMAERSSSEIVLPGDRPDSPPPPDDDLPQSEGGIYLPK
jgi:hypothetical protein